MRTRDRRRFRAILFLGVGLAASALALAPARGHRLPGGGRGGAGPPRPAARVHVLQGQELDSVDLRFAIRGKRAPSRHVVLVAIDDKTLADLRLRWPFPRSVHARLIDAVRRDGAKVIAFDVLFTEPSADPSQDDALIRSVDRARNVVLSAVLAKNGQTNVFGGADLRRFHTRAGMTLFPADPGGVVRRLPFEIGGVRGFALAAAERFRGHQLERSALGGGTAWIDYAGPEGTIPTVSYSDALRGKVDPAFFRGKIVVVGQTELALHDVHATSTTPTMSGPEIQANAIATALDDFPLQPVSAWWNALFVLGLGLLPALVGLRLRPLPTIAAALGGGAVFAVGAQALFDRGHIVQVVYPLGALALSSVGALGAHYLIEAFERQRTRDIFSRFVPEQVVNQVLTKTDAHLRLGGVRVTGTCMFTDLRDSTKFAESLPPEQVVEIVNRYLGELTEAILGHGGTLISYLGDGFMAIFGAPIEQPDHADRALAATREILEERLPRFNAWFRERGYGEGFRMGIGINTGVFLAGNVGSEKRLEYTAMGDTVNTASRLEGLTKGSGFSAFIAESTCDALVRPANDLVFAGEQEVRGREGKIKVWSLPAGQLAHAAETADARFEAAPAPA